MKFRRLQPADTTVVIITGNIININARTVITMMAGDSGEGLPGERAPGLLRRGFFRGQGIIIATIIGVANHIMVIAGTAVRSLAVFGCQDTANGGVTTTVAWGESGFLATGNTIRRLFVLSCPRVLFYAGVFI